MKDVAKLYEELRSIIDGGSESFTHEDAVRYLHDLQKREWVGLNDEDKKTFWTADQMTCEEWDELFNAVEAKLKEKNHDNTR